MPFGARIRNDANTLQIDETFRSMAYRFKATITTPSQNPSTDSGSDVTYDFSAVSPIVAVSCAYPVVSRLTYVSGSTWRMTMHTNGPIGTSITLFVFDTPSAPSHQWGMKVMDAAGNVTFHDNHRYIRIAHFRDFPAITGVNYMPTSHGSDTLASGRTYAVAGITSELCLGSTIWYCVGSLVSGNVIDYRSVGLNGNFGGFPTGDFRGRSVFLILDVTGY